MKITLSILAGLEAPQSKIGHGPDNLFVLLLTTKSTKRLT